MSDKKDTPVAQAVPMRYEINNPSTHLHLAGELKNFVTQNRLTTYLQGKEYANVEAWEYIGTSMGIFPVVETLEHIQREGEVCYRASVHLLNIHTNQIVGRGMAFCSNKEPGKQKFAEYAIASMAQTRAVGKAYRLPFGWLMKAAGYEPTPAEEMDVVAIVNEEPKAKKEAKKEPVQNPNEALILEACAFAQMATTVQQLEAVWKDCDGFHSEPRFKDAVKKRKAELTA